MPGKVAMSGKSCRVLFACEHLEIGGFGTHTMCFGRALRRRGHEVGALVAEPFGALYPDFLADLDHLELLRRGLETRKGYLRRTVDRLRELKPDVLINTGSPFVQAALPFLPAEMVRLSVVHSITPREVAIGLANPGWLDAVIAVSENVRDALKQQNTAGVPLAMIPVALDLPRAVVHQHAVAGPLLVRVADVTAEDARLILKWGESLDVYAALGTAQIAFVSLVFTIAGVLLFWRRSDDRMAFLISLWFAIFGVTGTPLLEPMVRAQPTWNLPVRFLQGASIAGPALERDEPAA